MSNGKLWSAREQLCKTFEQAQTSSKEGNSQMLGGPAMGLFLGEEKLLLVVEGNQAVEQHMWESAAGELWKEL